MDGFGEETEGRDDGAGEIDGREDELDGRSPREPFSSFANPSDAAKRPAPARAMMRIEFMIGRPFLGPRRGGSDSADAGRTRASPIPFYRARGVAAFPLREPPARGLEAWDSAPTGMFRANDRPARPSPFRISAAPLWREETKTSGAPVSPQRHGAAPRIRNETALRIEKG